MAFIDYMVALTRPLSRDNGQRDRQIRPAPVASSARFPKIR